MRAALPALAVAVLLAARVPAPPQGLAVIGRSWILAPAVSSTPSGYVGVLVNISLTIIEGHGDIYVSTSPLTDVDMQGSARAAVRAACSLLGVDCSHYDFLFHVEADTVIVGGPSAGLVMAVLTSSILTGRPLNRSVMATGMVAPDGSVGPVGGILEKANASARAGAKLFLVPLGQSVVVTYVRRERRVGPFIMYTVKPVRVNLTEYALENWGLRVREVVSLEDALEAFLGLKIPEAVGEPVASAEVAAACEQVASMLLRSAEGSLRRAKAALESHQLGPLARRYLRGKVGAAEALLQEVRGVSDPVLRAAKAYQPLAEAEWARLLVSYALGLDLAGYVEGLAANITSSWSGAEGLAQAFYLAGAEEALRLAQELWEGDVEASLYCLALAHAYTVAAEAWAKSGSDLLLGEVGERAGELVAEAGHTWSYASLILGEMELNSLRLRAAGVAYQLAKSALARGEALRALMHAVRGLSLAEAALDEAVIKAAGAVKAERLCNYARKLALRSLPRQPPALLLLLLKLGESSSDLPLKLLAYRYAYNAARAAPALPARKLGGGETAVSFSLEAWASWLAAVALAAFLALCALAAAPKRALNKG
ncbi:MAG: hypothetical protein DRJ67_00585 [Thermoprotei archaeon]|nr:MAG: hypothetical protein DRJ67_00585 [Thermoprotei archaeon]